MSEVTKDQMLMRADDIEDILNDVFARNMPELQEEEELGMGFGKEIFEMSKYKELGTILDMENKELEDVYLPPSYSRPFVEPRTTKEYNKMMDDYITERINSVTREADANGTFDVVFDGMDAETIYNKLKGEKS